MEQKTLHLGGLLLRLMQRASSASLCLLARILALLADAGDAVAWENGIASGNVSPSGASAQNMQWILVLVPSVFLFGRELELLAKGALEQAVEDAIYSGDENGGVDAAKPTPIVVGSDVWARWPRDSRWYRACVKFSAADHVVVTWSKFRGSVDGAVATEHAEYLSAELLGGGGDDIDTVALEVDLDDVVPLESGRPGASRVKPQGDESNILNDWSDEIAAVKRRSNWLQNLRELHGYVAAAVAQRGMSQAGPAVELQQLLGLKDSVSSLRIEAEVRSEALVKARKDCAAKELELQEQLRKDATSVREEVEVVQAKRAESRLRMQKLTEERQVILSKLSEIDRKILSEQGVDDELAQAEAKVTGGAAKVSEDHIGALTACHEREGEFAAVQRVIAAASEISSEVDAHLASRADAVSSAAERSQRLANAGPRLTIARLRAERTRRREFEALLAGWHALIWSTNVESFANDPVKLSLMRAAHSKAGALLDFAWREAVQGAAEYLGGCNDSVLEPQSLDVAGCVDGGGTTASEQMSRLAAQYKAMIGELGSNLQRLNRLEASAQMSKSIPKEAPPMAASSSCSDLASATHSVAQGLGSSTALECDQSDMPAE
eukprot:TRINITY_DN69890_c0_g1_i1.p1 TRINITY_DN69890_c0_g1~~TRINITY_DN69890_c0_g1_i1.p1  ORF type:complete len:681 (-),score=141.41 TRINITY_DN69890_c0_g1_i1:86-1912(-)